MSWRWAEAGAAPPMRTTGSSPRRAGAALLGRGTHFPPASQIRNKVPKLASAAEYFFKMGAEGKRFRPTVLLLMASALKFPISESTEEGVFSMLASTLRTRQQNIAEITEMIHVASLLHDDVLDDADTRRGVTSLNCIMGNKSMCGTCGSWEYRGGISNGNCCRTSSHW